MEELKKKLVDLEIRNGRKSIGDHKIETTPLVAFINKNVPHSV